jgi:HSP20 family protein
MARPYQRSIFDELDDLREYVNCMFQQALQPAEVPLLPGGETKDFPSPLRHEMKVDVVEHDDEVIVTADMIPGIEKKDISLDLINSHALRISCERREDRKEEKEGFYMHERKFGSIQRIIPVPVPVSEAGAKSTFKNGVLEVRLKKTKPVQKSKIAIE